MEAIYPQELNSLGNQLSRKVNVSDINKFNGYFGSNFDMQMSKDWDQTHPISKFELEAQQMQAYHLMGFLSQ